MAPISFSALNRRSISELDFPFLFDLYAGTRDKELSVIPWSPEQKHQFLLSQFQLQHAHYQTHFAGGEFSVITLEDKPIGRLYYRWDANELRLVDITLLPAYQRKGIGDFYLKQLMEDVTQRAGCFLLHVELNNPAREWYKRLGFTPKHDKGIYQEMQWLPNLNK